MKLTKREAIRETKRLWKEIEESGLNKIAFLYSSAEGAKWMGKNYQNTCPLCEYSRRFGSICNVCPLYTQYKKYCWQLGYLLTVNCVQEFFEAIRGLKE